MPQNDQKYLFLIIIIYSYNAEKLNDFFQNDYDVKMHIAKCSWNNKSCVKNCIASFDPYNRTQRMMNIAFELLIDFGSYTIVDIQLYKLMSNEYRFFPFTLKANVCVELYTTNVFGFKDLFDKTSNFTPCNMTKGVYYIRNAMPDFSRFPPRMPRGSYKVSQQMLFHSYPCAQLDFYIHIVDKPVDWKNIPKRKMH